MIWITGIVAFLVGAGAGALLFKLLRSDEAKVKALNLKLQELSEEHENYKSSVHAHFNSTARLLNEMTDSYRNVYQHLAKGAQNLCPDYISSQLSLENLGKPQLPSQDEDTKPAKTPEATTPEPVPPLDYAAREKADSEAMTEANAPRKGALDEDYGISRTDSRT